MVVASSAYSIALSDYMTKNLDEYVNSIIENILGDYPSGFGSIPYSPDFDPWNESDPWGEGDPWEGADPWDDEYWGDDQDYDWSGEAPMTEDELAVIETVRGSALEGFPEFSIEEVLLTRVEKDSLEWDCVSDEGGDYPAYYVCVSGQVIGDFVNIYAGFDVYEDGTIELFNLDDGSGLDEYYEDALKLYRDWYEAMLSSAGNTSSA